MEKDLLRKGQAESKGGENQNRSVEKKERNSAKEYKKRKKA